MVLTLYGFPSPTTQRVQIVLEEKKVPYSFVKIDLTKGQQKTPEYLEKHPFGVVPCIDDDGFILYECRAICRYIATKYESEGPKLIPTDLQGAALFEQAASAEVSYFNPHVGAIIREKVVKPRIGLATDEKHFAEELGKLKDKLDVFDKILSKHKYLAGDEISLVDLLCIPGGSMFPLCGIHVLEEKPNVARWWKDISSRPSWLAVQEAAKPQAEASK